MSARSSLPSDPAAPPPPDLETSWGRGTVLSIPSFPPSTCLVPGPGDSDHRGHPCPQGAWSHRGDGDCRVARIGGAGGRAQPSQRPSGAVTESPPTACHGHTAKWQNEGSHPRPHGLRTLFPGALGPCTCFHSNYVDRQISLKRPGCPQDHSGGAQAQPRQGRPVLTACLGQCPHFVHVRLTVWPVHLHHDKVLVGACHVWPAGGGGWREAAPRQCGLCRGAFQVRGRLDAREGADGVLGDQGQVGVQRPLGAGVGRGDRGIDGGGGRVLC